ncbi:autotransporter TcfA [Bordetella bronchiseptica]
MHIYGNMNRATPCRGAVRALALALLGAGMWTLSPASTWALELPPPLTDEELRLVLPTGMSLDDFKRSLQESAPGAVATPLPSSPPVAKPGPGLVAEAPSGPGHNDSPSPPAVGVGPGLADSAAGHNPGAGGGGNSGHENGSHDVGKVDGPAPGPGGLGRSDDSPESPPNPGAHGSSSGPDASTGSGPDAGMASGAGSASPGGSDGAGNDAMPPSTGERSDSGVSDSGRGGESPAGGLNPGGAGQPPREDGAPGSKSPADGGQDVPPPPRDGGDADPQPPRNDGDGEQPPPKGDGNEGQRPPPAAGNGGNGNPQLPERGDAGPRRPAGADSGVYLPGTHTLSNPANAAVGTASAAQGLWQAEMNALGKRMGELRLTPAAGGVWGRAFTQRQKLDNGVAREFRQTVGGFEVGADTALAAADGRWHIGAVAGYSHGKLKFGRSGTGEGDSVHVGAYATYIEDGGFYMDGIVRVARYAHEFKAPDAKGRRVRGKYRANGVGASLELGKRFTWAGAWYVEPQLEMAVFHAQGGSYRAGQDLRVKDNGLTSLLGRVGLHVGRQFDLGDGRVVQPYAKLSWLQEFDGKNTVRTNGVRHKSRLDGGRAELDLGVAAQLGKHGSLYGSYEYAKGSRQTMPWTFHIGYRYTW